MRLIRAAFVLLIAIDLMIMLLAVFLAKPLWILLAIVATAILKGWHDRIRIQQNISQYFKLKNKYHDKYIN